MNLLAGDARAAHASQSPDNALPDAGEVVSAYLALRAWTDGLDLPSLDDPQARLPLTNAAGVCVTLRRFGRVIGSATAVPTRHDSDLLARRALGRALSQALGDPAVAALPEDIRDSIGRGLTLELDVAGSVQPTLGRTWQRVARELEPGIDGVAIRQGNQWAALFPSQLLASNMAGNVANRLPVLAAELGLPAVDLNTLIQQHRVSVYRFRTLHLAQADPRSLPFETIRGDQLVADSAVTRSGIAAFAESLVRHLLGKIHDGDVDVQGVPSNPMGLLGDYDPVADAYRPLTAPPLDQALVSFALSRFAATSFTDPVLAAAARLQAGRLLRDLHTAHANDPAVFANPAVAAAIVFAAIAQQHNDNDGAIAEIGTLAASVVVNIDIEQIRDVHTRAMVAGAAARLLASDSGATVDAPTVRSMLDAAWQSVPEHQHVALLPWIGWGEMDYAQATGEPLARVEELHQVRQLLDASRVTSADAVAPDLHGGFALADGPASRPTAQVTRPAVFMATMLGEPTLTASEDVSPALGRHLQTMRFLMQLSVREESVWSMRNAERARGAIRSAPWDSSMPNAAQAMALLAATETLAVLGQ